MKQIFFSQLLLLSVLLLQSCNIKENARLRAENDSLRRELQASREVMSTVHQVKGLLDSIDESRSTLKVTMHEGTTYQDFKSRLSGINQYIKESISKIEDLEKSLKTSAHENEAYQMMVAALKDDLNIRAKEAQALSDKVAKYQNENKDLIQTVKLQESEIEDMHTTIQVKEQELALFNAKIEELAEKFKMSEAEAYYARGLAVEEAAKRTKLAPKKKRETLQEALELYKKSYSLGKQEAKAHIDALETKI